MSLNFRIYTKLMHFFYIHNEIVTTISNNLLIWIDIQIDKLFLCKNKSYLWIIYTMMFSFLNLKKNEIFFPFFFLKYWIASIQLMIYFKEAGNDDQRYEQFITPLVENYTKLRKSKIIYYSCKVLKFKCIFIKIKSMQIIAREREKKKRMKWIILNIKCKWIKKLWVKMKV